jgi:hypothetical protein
MQENPEVTVNVGAAETEGRPKQPTAEKEELSDDYVWNFINMIVKSGLKTHGGMVEKVVKQI